MVHKKCSKLFVISNIMVATAISIVWIGQTNKQVLANDMYKVNKQNIVVSSNQEHTTTQKININTSTPSPKVDKKTTKNSKYSVSDKKLLEQLVEAEAGCESFEGKLAVATIILNRVENKEFPKNITDVILQKNQFSPVGNGSINCTPSDDSKKAVSKVLDEGYRTFDKEIVYFCNPKISTSKWMTNHKKKAMQIGSHSFFYE